MAETQDMTATSRFYVFGLAFLTIGAVAFAVVSAFTESVIEVAVFGACAVAGGWGVYRSCYRTNLSDGYLVMRYLYRRRVVRLEQVRGIEFIESDEGRTGKFVVSLDDGSRLRVEANRSTRLMMESIVQRQPDVLVIGKIWPATKRPLKTQQDDERLLRWLQERAHTRKPINSDDERATRREPGEDR